MWWLCPVIFPLSPACSRQVKGQRSKGPRRADAAIQAEPLSQWKTISWREGSQGWLRKKFLARRAYRTVAGQPKQLGWLIGERPAREQDGDWKYYFSDLPKATPLKKMVEYAPRRFLIDQFHEEAKQLLGWDDYQGRLWQGFHRHATLVMLTHSFLCWQEWKQRQENPRSPGRPRDPFSPSERPQTMLA